MILFKVMGIGLLTVAISLIIKPYRPEFSFFLSIFGGVTILCVLLSYLESYLSIIKGIFSDSGVLPEYFSIALKALGIGYISEFAANTALDSGQSAIASKIIFAGKVCIFVVSLPLIKNLLDLATELVGK